jgi:ubiquinone/menaquinone biosynthesis C-methylase UbiE
VPAAKLGADVLGVVIARNLVEAGNRRAQEQGLQNLRFEEGDATDLAGLQDDAFDLVVSIFGAMFAPKPFEVAKEMVRVTRPGEVERQLSFLRLRSGSLSLDLDQCCDAN